METAPAVFDHLPATQLVQVVITVAPVAADQVPAIQLMHTVAPATFDHVPVAQF